jgi:hypothetical protein
MGVITGGCECGKIRYEVTHKPLMMLNCHCHSCQKVSGGAYTPVVIVASQSFKVTQGAIKYHHTTTINGEKHKRGFCADCGSRLTGAEIDEPRPFLGITASSLDDPTIFSPTMDLFVSHAQPWDRMDPKLAKHDTYAPK